MGGETPETKGPETKDPIIRCEYFLIYMFMWGRKKLNRVKFLGYFHWPLNSI